MSSIYEKRAAMERNTIKLASALLKNGDFIMWLLSYQEAKKPIAPMTDVFNDNASLELLHGFGFLSCQQM